AKNLTEVKSGTLGKEARIVCYYLGTHTVAIFSKVGASARTHKLHDVRISFRSNQPWQFQAFPCAVSVCSGRSSPSSRAAQELESARDSTWCRISPVRTGSCRPDAANRIRGSTAKASQRTGGRCHWNLGGESSLSESISDLC